MIKLYSIKLVILKKSKENVWVNFVSLFDTVSMTTKATFVK